MALTKVGKTEKTIPQNLYNELYPNSWNEGLFFSIHESGEKENPNNFPNSSLFYQRLTHINKIKDNDKRIFEKNDSLIIQTLFLKTRNFP